MAGEWATVVAGLGGGVVTGGVTLLLERQRAKRASAERFLHERRDLWVRLLRRYNSIWNEYIHRAESGEPRPDVDEISEALEELWIECAIIIQHDVTVILRSFYTDLNWGRAWNQLIDLSRIDLGLPPREMTEISGVTAPGI